MIRFILTDIEGTTSDISFVKEILFPYAAQHLPNYIRQFHQLPKVSSQLKLVAEESQCSIEDVEQLIATLLSWIEQDLKKTPLKELQGEVWAYGYEQGHFKGHLYQDAFEQLSWWQQQGLALGIYSSGSVKAQKLLFSHSDYGDLTPLFSQYYDTKIGHKREVQAYQAIVQDLLEKGVIKHPEEVLFLSDVVAELDAAQAAGLHTAELRRDQQKGSADHPSVSSFNQLTACLPLLAESLKEKQ